jgi:hypothetical protein
MGQSSRLGANASRCCGRKRNDLVDRVMPAVQVEFHFLLIRRLPLLQSEHFEMPQRMAVGIELAAEIEQLCIWIGRHGRRGSRNRRDGGNDGYNGYIAVYGNDAVKLTIRKLLSINAGTGKGDR